MTMEEVSKKINTAVDYLGTLKVEGYKNAKILVEGLEFLDNLSLELLKKEISIPNPNGISEVLHDNSDK